MINWKEKLTSRKFWIAVSTILVGTLNLFSNGGEIAGTIIMICSTVAYILGEAIVDANRDRKDEENGKTENNF